LYNFRRETLFTEIRQVVVLVGETVEGTVTDFFFFQGTVTPGQIGVFADEAV